MRDDLLRLVFTCCHPALSAETQVALSLRTLAGLSTAETARALLVPEQVMAKRLTRAKQKIARAGIPYRVPADHELPDRLRGVAATVYLLFNEGWAPGDGEQLVRPALIDEAVRLARLLHELMPDEPTVLGLLALLLLLDARRAARSDGDGLPVLLGEQDRALFDQDKVQQGVVLLGEGLRRSSERPDAYVVQAAVAACHVLTPATDWAVVCSWYDVLLTVQDTPAVRLAHAVAVGERDGALAGLRLLDQVGGMTGSRRAARGEGRAAPSHRGRRAGARRVRRGAGPPAVTAAEAAPAATARPGSADRERSARERRREVRHRADRRHDARVARVPDDRFPHVEVRTASELRDWLDEHAGRDEAVWLVTWKKGSPHHMPKDEVLDELVAHGWTDGVMRRLDDERVMQLVSPRRTQPWARSYKDRAERLTAQGRMHPAGTAAVELARATGGWDAHADVDALIVPEDLTAALQAHPPAAEHFAGFPPSTRRNVLRWIASAKRPETRSRRVLLTATEAQAGRRVASNG